MIDASFDVHASRDKIKEMKVKSIFSDVKYSVLREGAPLSSESIFF